MDYGRFCSILNKSVIEGEKARLLRILAEKELYLGKFSLLKAKDVLSECLQHLLQSHEIRMGDALEEIIEEMLKDIGYKVLSKSMVNDDGEQLTLDQYFTDGKIYYFIEQKVRDDHDSTKKRGQTSNFEAKLEVLHRKHGDKLIGVMYFIDPDLVKNKNFYLQELNKFQLFYGVKLHLFYGKELFDYLGRPEIWDNILAWLEEWKDSLPELPEINFDTTPQESFEEIKDLELRYLRKILENEKLWEEGIIKTISREGATLRLLLDFCSKQSSIPYRRSADLLTQRLQEYYE